MIKFSLNPLGLGLIICSAALPWLWVAPLTARYPTGALFSQFAGMASLVTMAWIQILATRLRGLEPIFGPLDQIYRLHKWLGIAALVLALLHDTLESEIKGLGRKTPLNEFAEGLGEWGLNGLIALIVGSVLMLIPYRLWYFAHRFIGVFFALSALHFLLIRKPFSNTDILGIYVGAFCLVGLLAYLWKLTPRARRMRGAYKVAQTSPSGTSTVITLTPNEEAIRHRPGQFAFFSFDLPGGKEVHPFTISSAPRPDGQLRVSAAPLGDFTQRVLPQITAETQVRIEGGFGRFHRRKGRTRELWIAGGIGITPFLAWAEAMQADDRPAVLFYCVKNRRDAAHIDEIEARARSLPNLELVLWESDIQPRLSSADIAAHMADDLRTTHTHFCGPAPMREALRNGLHAAGLPRGRFHAEAFEMRTGIGIERLLRALLSRLKLWQTMPDRMQKLLERS